METFATGHDTSAGLWVFNGGITKSCGFVLKGALSPTEGTGSGPGSKCLDLVLVFRRGFRISFTGSKGRLKLSTERETEREEERENDFTFREKRVQGL